MSRLLLCPLVVLVCASLVSAATPTSELQVAGIHLAPSTTRVGLARVHLDVSDLRLTGNALTGSYEIRVPLLPTKNETGSIRLEAAAPLDELETIGGELTGSAFTDGDETRDVRCEIDPRGTIRIDITTDHRTLRFKTEYEIIDGS